MLVLTRLSNESILITLPTSPDQLLALAGHVLKVAVVEIRGSKARLGLEADQSIKIVRTEIDDGRTSVQ